MWCMHGVTVIYFAESKLGAIYSQFTASPTQ